MFDQIVEALGIGALLDHESEIDSETLKTLGRSHGVGMATRSLSQFG